MRIDPPLVGRDRELDTIVSFLDAATPGVMLIEGEPGIGKTALWEEGLAHVGERRILSCRPTQTESGLSFSALGDLLGAAVTEVLDDLPVPQRDALGAALLLTNADGRRDHRAVGAGTLSVLKELSASGPVVIAIDDLQWLDRPSARALGFALRRLSTEPVTVLATKRIEPTTSVLMLEAAIREGRVARLPVGPLSLGALGRLLTDRLGVRFPRTTTVRIHQVCGGNPLHALELARAIAATGAFPAPGEPLPVPEDVHALLRERIARLPAQTRKALLLASLLSPPSEQILARAVGRGWDAAVDRMRASGIADIAGDMLRFSHPLLASAVVSSATTEARRLAHLTLADAIDEAELRARHLALGSVGPSEDVAAALEDAARLASRRGAPESAAELAGLSVNLTPADDAEAVARRCIIAGEARFSAGDLSLAEERFRRAADLGSSGKDRAEALWHLGRVRAYRDVTGSVPLLEEARAEAGDDDRLNALIEHALSFPAFVGMDLRKTLQHAGAAVDHAERSGGTVRLDALGALAGAQFLSGMGADRTTLDRALDSEDWDEAGPVILRPTILVSHVLSWLDAYDDARSLLERAEQELRDRGDEVSLPFLAYRLAELDCWTGHWERGLERARSADDLAAETGQHAGRSTTSYSVALLAAHLGRADDARAFAGSGVALALEGAAPLGLAMNTSVLGFLEASLGDHTRAVEVLVPLVQLARSAGLEEPALLWFLPELIESLVAVGDVEQARSLTAWLDEGARAIDRPRGLAGAARCRALLTASEGNIDEALAACGEALTQHERVTIPFERARTLLVRGQIARRARRWGLARSSLEKASAEFTRLGAALWEMRAREELARVGGRAPSAGQLTPSEHRVAELVVTGRTNKEIAEALYLSPKTVASTLSRVYRKTGVATRAELAARLAREGLNVGK